MKKVLITYPDNSSRIISLAGLYDQFRDESSPWNAHFFYGLLHLEAEMTTNFAKYKLMDLEE